MTSKTPLDKAIDFVMEFDGEDEVCKILPALKAAKRDESRLDWMEKYVYVVGWTYGKFNAFKKNGKLKKATIRQVIDRAIRKEKRNG